MQQDNRRRRRNENQSPRIYKKSDKSQNTAKILGIKDYYAELNRKNNNPYIENNSNTDIDHIDILKPIENEDIDFNAQNIMQVHQYPNNIYQDMQNRQRKNNVLPYRIMAILFVVINVIIFAVSFFMDAYVVSSKAAKNAEHERIVNNHPLYYRLDIEANAKEYNLQPALISAIIKNESSFQPDAQSNVGALGLMQLMPDTAEWISGKIKDKSYTFQRMADPKENIKYGCWYLNFLSKRFNNDVVLVVAAYHAGQGTVANWLSDSTISKNGYSIDIDSLPDGPTKTYVRRVYKAYAIYNALYFSQASI